MHDILSECLSRSTDYDGVATGRRPQKGGSGPYDMTQDTLELGGGPAGSELATELAAQGRTTTLVDGEPRTSRARETGLLAHEPTVEIATLFVDSAAAIDTGTGVSATAEDARRVRLDG